jgi:hypothetical protein
MAFPSRFFKRNIRTILGSALTGTLQNVGAVTNCVGYKVTFVNATSVDIVVSDGTSDDNYYLPAGSTLSIGEGTIAPEGQAPVRQGTQFQAEAFAGAAGTGTLVITVIGS